MLNHGLKIQSFLDCIKILKEIDEVISKSQLFDEDRETLEYLSLELYISLTEIYCANESILSSAINGTDSLSARRALIAYKSIFCKKDIITFFSDNCSIDKDIVFKAESIAKALPLFLDNNLTKEFKKKYEYISTQTVTLFMEFFRLSIPLVTQEDNENSMNLKTSAPELLDWLYTKQDQFDILLASTLGDEYLDAVNAKNELGDTYVESMSPKDLMTDYFKICEEED